METNRTKERLKKRLKKRQQDKTGIPVLDNQQEETDIFHMISQVQKILKSNPELVTKVSNCVNNLMGNEEMMKQLNEQIQKESDSQTLVASTSGDNPEAISKSS